MRGGPGRGWMRPGVEYELDGLGHLPQIEDFGRFVQTLLRALELD